MTGDFWRHIVIGAAGAAGLAAFQSLSGQNFGQYNAEAQLLIQVGIEFLNQYLGVKK